MLVHFYRSKNYPASRRTLMLAIPAVEWRHETRFEASLWREEACFIG